MEKVVSKNDESMEVEYNETVVPDVVPSDLEQSSQTHSQSITLTQGSKPSIDQEKDVDLVKENSHLPKAEGLHAWLVVFSAFLCNVITYGIGTSW